MNGRLFRSLAAGSMAAGMVLAVATPTAGAVSTATDPGDSISPANTVVTATSPTSGTGEFSAVGTIDGVMITVTCTTTSFSGKTPKKGLSVTIAPPTFSGCTDSTNHTDTVTTNNTNGQWKLKFKDAANDETGEKPGDKLALTIPKNGATFTSAFLPGCTVIVAAGPKDPSGPATVTTAYDDVSQSTLTNGKLPVGNNGGCTTGDYSLLTVNYTLSPGVHDVS